MYSWVISWHVSFLPCDNINQGNIIQFISKVTGQADNPDDFVDIDHKLPTEDTDHWEDALMAQHLPSTKPDSDNDSVYPHEPKWL